MKNTVLYRHGIVVSLRSRSRNPLCGVRGAVPNAVTFVIFPLAVPRSPVPTGGALPTPGHRAQNEEVAHLCSPVFPHPVSREIDEGLYLRRGTSYGLTSCVFRVMPRDLIILLIINRERRNTLPSREREVPGAAAAANVRSFPSLERAAS